MRRKKLRLEINGKKIKQEETMGESGTLCGLIWRKYKCGNFERIWVILFVAK